jgi:maleylpyruvate isomerase
MASDLHDRPEESIILCAAAHERLLATARRLTDAQARSLSLLPGWSVGHVLTHLARNADGHVVRLEGALRGEDIPRYPGGDTQRKADIVAGAGRPAAELVDDLDTAQQRLEAVWRRSVEAGWPHRELRGADQWDTPASPIRRVSEVEMHHVDLGLGYGPQDWPADYVAWQLPALLVTLPSRCRADDQRRLVAWLAGRASLPEGCTLDPW